MTRLFQNCWCEKKHKDTKAQRHKENALKLSWRGFSLCPCAFVFLCFSHRRGVVKEDRIPCCRPHSLAIRDGYSSRRVPVSWWTHCYARSLVRPMPSSIACTRHVYLV